MILLIAALLAAAPPPLSSEPFMDEEAAAHALEAHLFCLGTAAFERRNDSRNAAAVAAIIESVYKAEATTLRAALRDVYRRKPQLISSAMSIDEAADAYVNDMNGRITSVVTEGRKHKQ